MGEGINKNDQRAAGTEGRGKTGATGNSGTGSTSNSRGSRGRRGQAEKTELPKLVAIEVPGGKEEEEKKPEQKKRGRPKGSTKKAAPKKATKTDTIQVELLLTTTFGIIGSRPGLEMFTLSAAEAKQIAEPLSNILSKNEALAGAMSEHGDAVALVTACFMIFVPKFLAYKQQKPKKEKKNEVSPHVSTPRNETRKNPGNRQRDDKQVTAYDEANSHKFGGQLHRITEPIAGFGY